MLALHREAAWQQDEAVSRDRPPAGRGQVKRATVGAVFPSRFLGSYWAYLRVPTSSNGSGLEVVVLGVFE